MRLSAVLCRLTVTDSDGESDSTTATVTVNDGKKMIAGNSKTIPECNTLLVEVHVLVQPSPVAFKTHLTLFMFCVIYFDSFFFIPFHLCGDGIPVAK